MAIYRTEDGRYRGPETIDEFTEEHQLALEAKEGIKNFKPLRRYFPLGVKIAIGTASVFAGALSLVLAVGAAMIFKVGIDFFGADKFKWLTTFLIFFFSWIVGVALYNNDSLKRAEVSLTGEINSLKSRIELLQKIEKLENRK